MKYIKMLVISFLCFTIIFSGLAGCGNDELKKLKKNMSTYNLDLDVDCNNKLLKGNMNLEYKNNCNEGLEQLYFHLYPNAFKDKDGELKPVSDFNFDKAYPNGFSSGSIAINEVDINGENATFALGGECENILIVNLKGTLFPDEKTKITIKFDVTIPNVIHRFGYGDNSINVGNFYPIVCVYENGKFVTDGYHYNGDPFYSEMANYFVTITYDKTYKIGASGDEVFSEEKDDKITKKFKANLVRDFAFALSEKYECETGSYKNTKINYLHYTNHDAKKVVELIHKTLNTLGNLIGEYPYKTITVVDANFIHGGMEYPNFAIISDSEMSEEDYYYVIVHELAHQWFYNLVGNDEVKNAWLDEGLTEYTTLMFFEINDEYGIKYKDKIASMLNNYLLFEDIYKDVFGTIDTSMNRSLKEYGSEPEYTYYVYVKSVLMFDNLRSVIGDSAFCLALKQYFKDNKYKIATPSKLIKAFTDCSKYDVKSFIDSWVEGKVVIQ